MNLQEAKQLVKDIEKLEKTSMMDGIKGLESEKYFNEKMEERNELIESKAKRLQMLSDAKGFLEFLEGIMKNTTAKKSIWMTLMINPKMTELKEIIKILKEVKK